jgi:hypothetical protein
VGTLALHAHLGVEHAVASQLELEIRRLEQDRERGLAQPRHLLEESLEAVTVVRALLGVIEHRGEIEAQRARLERLDQREQHRIAALHVGGAEAVDAAVASLRAPVVLRGHCVDVAGQHDQRLPRRG